MAETLLALVRRFADANADANGIAATPIRGLTLIRAARPGELQYAISRPLVTLVLQGRKHVMMGKRALDFGAGESLLITADVPTASQITRANVSEPYYSLVFDLDSSVIEELVTAMEAGEGEPGPPVRVDPTEAEVVGAALRLMQLIDRPKAVPILQAQLAREMHYWLLAGRHGSAIRRLGAAGSATRIARAVAIIRSQFAKPMRIERLAKAAGMSASTFHEHFRAVTSLSPLQFQKQLRLIEARRLMLAERAPAAAAAHAVGYESVPQFTREYGRMFGTSPVRDVKSARERVFESGAARAAAP